MALAIVSGGSLLGAVCGVPAPLLLWAGPSIPAARTVDAAPAPVASTGEAPQEKPQQEPPEKPQEAPPPKPPQDKPPAAPGEKLAPLPITLPRPLFIGTPRNFRVTHLEKPLGKPRPPFLAPPGVKNVARGKPVSGSDEEPIIGELSFLVDGKKSGADGTYVDLTFGRQHVQIDLEAVHELFAIVVWHFHQEARVYHDVVVQVAQDADFTAGVRTLFNNDDDNSSGLGVGKDRPYVETHEGKLIDARRVKARYVRLYSCGNTSNEQNHYVEVEVWGRPVR